MTRRLGFRRLGLAAAITLATIAGFAPGADDRAGANGGAAANSGAAADGGAGGAGAPVRNGARGGGGLSGTGADFGAGTPAATLTRPTPRPAPPEASGFIQRWMVLEPIPAAGLTDSAVRTAVGKEYFADQLTFLPRDGDKVAVNGQELVWHAEETSRYNLNLFHFARALRKPSGNALFWVVTVVNCPDEVKDARLAVGSNAASVWWVDGKEVVALYGDRQTVIDDGVSRRLTLKKGPNVVRGAVINGFGATDYCARFLDAQDKPITTITITLEAPAGGTPATAPATMPAVDQHGPTIKETYADHFLIGTAGDIPGNYSDAETALIKQNFGVVTPENCMKPAPVHPAEDTWRFERPDALMKWCEDNRIAVHGHTLVWHAQTNDWFFDGGDKAVVTRRLKDHIITLVGRYRGKVRGWDVVNEAINDGGNAETGRTENLRNSRWLQTLGPEFLTLAFKFAHEADPDATLYYNDYNIEAGPKHASSLVLLKRLIADGAPVHGVGIQGHWNTASIPYAAIDKAIADYASLGLKVSITELDVTIRGASGGQLGPGGFGGRGPAPATRPGAGPATAPAGGAAGAPATRPFARGGGFGGRGGPVTPPSPQDLQAQAEAYARLFSIFAKHKDVVERVTFWGLSDRRTWRFGQNPLIFDTNNQRKPAYVAIVDALQHPKPYPPAPR